MTLCDAMTEQTSNSGDSGRRRRRRRRPKSPKKKNISASQVLEQTSQISEEEPVEAKLSAAEIAEFKEAVLSGVEKDMTEELGDLLFVLVNIAKFKKIDAEEALRATNNKFIKRFQHIEAEVAKRGKTLKETPLEELEQYWQDAKG